MFSGSFCLRCMSAAGAASSSGNISGAMIGLMREGLSRHGRLRTWLSALLLWGTDSRADLASAAIRARAVEAAVRARVARGVPGGTLTFFAENKI